MLLTANNHSNDTGRKGFARTQQVIQDAGLVHIGTRPALEDKNYYVADINGIKVGMINYTYNTAIRDDGSVALNGLPLVLENSKLINSFNYDHLDEFYSKLSGEIEAMRGDGAEALRRLTGQQVTAPENPDAPLTRAQLAVLLQEAASQLGLPAQWNGTAVSYLDMDLTHADSEESETTWKQATLWAVEQGLFASFVGNRLLPNTAVSRLQLAQAMVALRAMNPEDTLAAEILQAIPSRNNESLALKNHDAIQAAVDTAAKKYGADGLQVAVIENGIVTDTYTYGWATKNTDEMTADHKIRIASISKVVVGITAQLLREDGIVDLDADISEYWGVKVQNPRYKTIPITISGMLSHTSSIFSAGDSTSRAYNSVKSMLQGPAFRNAVPGDIGYWSYNNYAFGVLGMTLELAADRVIDDILGERLYTPMDIDAAFGSGDLKNTDLIATIYRASGEVGRSVSKSKTLHSPETPGENGIYFAGGLTASAYDVAKLISLLAGDGMYEGVQLMSPESVAIMETYNETPVPGGSYQAFPMRYWPQLYGREGIYFHTGSAYGVFSAATYDPVSGDGVVVLTSGASGSKDAYGIYKVCAAINEYIYNTIQ